jgi:hypothetical protein
MELPTKMKNKRKNTIASLLVLVLCSAAAVSLGPAAPVMAGGGETCEGDVDGNGQVDILDLLSVIQSWGNCPDEPEPCPADLNGDGVVNVNDLLIVLKNFGPCDEVSCESAADCDDGDDCTVDLCIHGLCFHFEIPDCE